MTKTENRRTWVNDVKKDKTGKKNTTEKSTDDEESVGLPEVEGDTDKDRDVDDVANETGEDEKATEITASGHDPMARLQEELAAVKKEKEELNDRFLRAAADFDNYKKRLDRQWIDFKKYANEELVKELLAVIDNLERAIAAGQEMKNSDKLIEGVKMTLDEILKVLERFNVTPIKAVGEKFNPEYHQAVSTRKAEEVEENIVLEEYQKGYLIHDRLLRPAMVVVSAAA